MALFSPALLPVAGGESPRPSDRVAPLPSRLAAGLLAVDAVDAVAGVIAALAGADPLPSDPDRVAAAYRSDRHLRVDGGSPDVWSPLSGFWRTADGWVRTHGNYPHHAAALRAGLGLARDAGADDLARRLSGLGASAAADVVRARGGLCVAVRREDPPATAALRRHPVVRVERLRAGTPRPLPGSAATAPLRGVRVLDLTRVIAGPVATRTLALAGADVLRIDRPDRPEFDWQHLDTGHGKRSALLDVRADPAQLEILLAGADVVVLGYRPEGLRPLGLSPDALAARHPHLVVAQLSAAEDPALRGFDSLVQAASGISWIESVDGEMPGALPAQALDHTAGYLLAAGVCVALRLRATVGGSWRASTSLQRVAAELLGLPRTAEPAGPPPPTEPETQEFRVGGRRVTTVVPAVRWTGGPTGFSAPRPWGADPAVW